MGMHNKKIYKHIRFSFFSFIVDWAIMFCMPTTFFIFAGDASHYIIMVLLAIIEFVLISIIYKKDKIIDKVCGIVGTLLLIIATLFCISRLFMYSDTLGIMIAGALIINAQVLLLIILLIWHVITRIKQKNK